MRAIDYGIKLFGGYSLKDSQTNIIVFNEKIVVENPDQIEHVVQDKWLVECVFNGQYFEVKENGDVITAEEFAYLLETEVEPIHHHTAIVFLEQQGLQQKKIYKINEQFFVFVNSDIAFFENLDNVTISNFKKGSGKIIKSKPVLLNERLKENKQAIIIFISSNGALIESAYKDIDQIRENELVFFIESKEDSNIFGSVVRVASGASFTSINQLPLNELSKVVNIYETSIRPVDFDIILKNHINTKDTVYLVKRFFLGLLSEVVIINAGTLSLSAVKALADGIVKGLNFITIDDSRWKYYNEDGSKIKNNKILLPVDAFENNKNQELNLKIYAEQLVRLENSLDASVKSWGGELLKNNKVFKKLINKIKDVLDMLVDFIQNPFDKDLAITKNILIFYNAYIIGIINGFIEAIKGFFSLISSLVDFLEKSKDEVKKGNIISQWIILFESIENFYDLLTNLFTLQNLKALYRFCKKALLLSPLLPFMTIHYLKNTTITSDRLGYNLGYVIGTIVELIVEVLLTGGAKTVSEAVQLLVKQMDALLQNLTKTTQRATDDFVEGIILIYAKLNQITKNFPQFLDELYQALLQWFARLEDFFAIFGKETLALFSKHGVDIRKVPQARLYTGIPIPVGDNVYALMRDGREIFRGAKSEVNDFANHLKKMSDAEAKKFLDDIAKGNKLKLAEKMWAEFTYEHLMKIPPSKKPCFLAGTLVKTENGHLPIEQIKVGDKVFTYNLDKKQTEINSVSRVYENVTQKYLKITTKNSCIEATGQHRFWIPKQEKWLMANELKTGMHFLDTNNNLVEILNLEIIENTEKTYNLEIENNHNYFVGQDEILTHNTNKVFKFADETLYDFGFYELVKGKGVDDVLYVGITTQPFDVRNSQHAQEGRAASKYNKPYNAWKANADLLRIKPDYTKMTFYEATVWETYFINERGGGKAHKGLGKLLNRKTPISEKMFNDMKKTGKFNPCKYFI